MQYKYVSPFKLLTIYGITGTIITTIIGTLSTFIECNKVGSSIDMKICKIKDINYNIAGKTYLENFKIWKDEIDNNEIFLLSIGIISNFFYRIFYFIIIKNLTAIHTIFSNLFYSTILAWIGSFVKDNKNNNNNYVMDAFNFIIQIIVTFGLLI